LFPHRSASFANEAAASRLNFLAIQFKGIAVSQRRCRASAFARVASVGGSV